MKIRLLENTVVDVSIYQVDGNVEITLGIGTMILRVQLPPEDARNLGSSLQMAAPAAKGE